MSKSFSRNDRLTKADEFSSAFSFGRRATGRFFQVFARPNGLENARLGMVVSKRIMPLAVSRNYSKRLIREIFRYHKRFLKGFDIVVKVRKTWVKPAYTQVQPELIFLFEKLLNVPFIDNNN